MVAARIPAPTFVIGAGGANKHAANENVPVSNLMHAGNLYRAILREVLPSKLSN
jgi:acetylornithine deacetylase/succinyl-diaminopimelate desuccinylase-like protein